MSRSFLHLAPICMLSAGCSLISDFEFSFALNEPPANLPDGGEDAGDGPDTVDPTPDSGHEDTPDGGSGDTDGSADSGPADPLCAAALCDPVADCDSSTGVAVCTCPRGFYDANGDGTDCIDLNECRAGLEECDEEGHERCVNTPGSYSCECEPGYVHDNSQDACLDSCAVLLSTTCDANVGLCTKPDGNPACRCPAGYFDVNGDGTVCAPDEVCMALECDEYAVCDSTESSPSCTCPPGFTGDGTTCFDVEECADNVDDCDPNADCTNHLGGYACTCKPGFTGDGKSCADEDECAAGTDLCSNNATCTNKANGYECTCNTGYAGDGFTCMNENECELGTSTCSPNANCQDTVGSFTCACKPGFTGDGTTCDDVDECGAGTANCGVGIPCSNTVGSYTCGCDPGYRKNASGQCVDVDECEESLSNCSTNATCTNTAGSFGCDCKEGYDGDGVSCQDINECAPGGANNCSPDATCANAPGSFGCTCKSGYTGSGTTCTNINECAPGGSNTCTTREDCIDTPGSYECRCKTGYSGPTCADIDECALGTDTCDHTPNACVNTQGSYNCACPSGYTGSGTGENGCADVNECATNNGGCGSATYITCVNNIGAAPTCNDINECATNNGGCGSATYWTCTNNYAAARTCTDINECATNNGGCGNATFTSCTNNSGAAPTCTDINECATNNGGCGSATYITCVNNAGAAPTCNDINECLTNNGGCGSATYWSCTNNYAASRTCTDINECALGTDQCDDLPVATCNNTNNGYGCICPAGYSGTGMGQTGCCVPDGSNDQTLPNDGKDNDCDGTIDRPVITQAGTFPEPGGATTTAHVAVQVTASSVSGAVLECRSYKRTTTVPPAFVTCSNPAKNPADQRLASNNGAWRTDVRWRFLSGATSSIASYDYYVHNSLAGDRFVQTGTGSPMPRCAPPAATDAQIFTFADAQLRATSVGAGYTDPGAFGSDTVLTTPWITIGFRPLTGGMFMLRRQELSVPAGGTTTFAANISSLRHRFVVSPNGRYVLIRRVYPSRMRYDNTGAVDCKAARFNIAETHWALTGPNYSAPHLACDVVVLNRAGAGECLSISATGVITQIAHQNVYETPDGNPNVYGYGSANKFMWRQLVEERGWHSKFTGQFQNNWWFVPPETGYLNFSEKCDTAGCNNDNYYELYLPDKNIIRP